MPKQVFLAHFELMVARFGPPQIQKCLENGLFCDQKWVKNGSKMCFYDNDPRPFGVPNKQNEPILSPLQAILATPKSQNALKMGCFHQKSVNKQIKNVFFQRYFWTIWVAQTSGMSPF